MKDVTKLTGTVLAALLAVCLAGYFALQSEGPAAKPSKARGALVDTSPVETAQQLAGYAATADEQAQAREAWRLADHAVDLAFAAAVRDAEAQATIPASGPARDLANRVDRLKDKVEADKKRLAAVDKDDSDALDRAQAELTLDQDELDDFRQELDSTGNRGDLRRLLQEHEASDKAADQGLKFPSPPEIGTLAQQLKAWFVLREEQVQLSAAQQGAAAGNRAATAEHQAREQNLNTHADRSTAASMRAVAAQRKTLAGLDQRIQDTQQLQTVYGIWWLDAHARERSVVGLMLRSLAIILTILLAALLLNRVVARALPAADRRRGHQLRTITRIGLQVAAALLVLMVVFGPPTQLSTIIGLVTAGLTVVMKDFIVAFFGWFTLMGRNGMSVGDWVEIEGVSGEVIEIGLLKTVLLEVGNWTDKGHPTGRRVAFSNSFAIEKHFFNFSTSGQWLWDEIRVTIPPGGDPYEAARRIGQIVEEETKSDAAAAAEDWERVAHHHGAREFSAAPAISLRPGPNGLEAVVRYITRAPRRNAAQARIFAAIVDLLHRAV
jgi:small-conductance mechanosensitive channel